MQLPVLLQRGQDFFKADAVFFGHLGCQGQVAHLDAGGIILFFPLRKNVIVKNIARFSVGDGAFQAVSYLNAHFTALPGQQPFPVYQKEHAVVFVFFPQPPAAKKG